jgi:death-on-curing protein
MDDPVWISRELVIAIHRRQLAEHGGIDGVRDIGILDSTLARPRQQFAYADPKPDPCALAAAYSYGIARNHPFLDGNKRSAFVICRVFLVLNGQDIDADKTALYETFFRLADGSLSEDQLAGWLRKHLKRPG